MVMGSLVVRAEPEELRQVPMAGWLEANGMTGDWGGMRTGLQERGVEFFGGYMAEVWGNTTGGEKTGAVYTGLLDFGLEVDLERALGWSGASVSTTWLWISGKDASEELVGNFFTISNIAGFQTLRMLELWFQQNFWEDKVSVRIGQLTADSEFVISDYAGVFLNGTFGWPAFMYMNLPAGGPGYPMGTPGVRLALQPVGWFSFQTAVFQGNVYDQDVNRHGFRWRLDGENGFLFLNEARGGWGDGLPGQFKAGFWAQSGRMADVLAESTDSGNFGWYFIADQMLYREAEAGAADGSGKAVAGGKGGKSFESPDQVSGQGLGWFGRLAFQKGDRNFVDFYFDTGLAYRGLIPGRDDDTVGVGFAFAQVGGAAGGQLLAEGSRGIGGEMVLEATYQAQITPWLAIQPDLQFIINPGGTRDFGNALVVGGRLAVTF